MRSRLTCRRGLPCLVAAVAFLLSSCEQSGHFTVLGYTTQPNYDPEIRNVRVPIFKNKTFRRGLEFELTKAVIREIEAKTPFKVVSPDCAADTELQGTIVTRGKSITTLNQLGEVREAETTLAVELVWRDLRAGRTGDVLSNPIVTRPGEAPTPPKPGAATPPVLVQSLATFQPELGLSLTSAEKVNVDRLAVQIVSMMEKPW